MRGEPGFRVAACECEMKTVVVHESRQKARALPGRHELVENEVSENGSVGEHHRDIGVALRKLFHHETGGQVVGACTAGFVRERERTQTHLRRGCEQIRQQRFLERLQASRVQGDRFDFVADEIAHRVANLELFRSKMKIVHTASL